MRIAELQDCRIAESIAEGIAESIAERIAPPSTLPSCNSVILQSCNFQ
jgi:hypothetical protein